MTTGGKGENTSARKIGIELLLLSILALFCELVVIRWLSTEIRIFAYFKNVPLLAAFLGLGFGFIWTDRKRDYYQWSAVGLLFLSGVLAVAFKLRLTYLTFVAPDQFLLWGLQAHGEKVVPLLITARNLLIMIAIFVLTTSIFVGLGQRMGRLFSQLKPLSAYSINVLGSLLGSLLLVALSFTGTNPGLWLVVAGALFFAVDRRAISATLIIFGIAYSVWLGPYLTRESFDGLAVKTVWSPYYRIDAVRKMAPPPLDKVQLGYNIYINYDSFQSILDCTQAALSPLPVKAREAMLEVQTEPFRLLDKPNQEVLILGSGTGSDIAAALRTGNIGHIDAVEIDPAILKLGEELHPEHPYASPKVSVYVTDARNYLQDCKKKYDVIVFATLDSHAAFSALSSLRMDNFVFTEESLKTAASLLKPDGVIYIHFMSPNEWLWERHSKNLAQATGRTPIGYHIHGEQEEGTLVGGQNVSLKSLPKVLQDKGVIEPKLDTATETSTDNWPFLFLPRKEIPSLYILPLAILLGLSAIPVSTQFAKGARDVGNWQMFFLGMAFMLLEVRAMSDLSLLFGSTWIVNSVVISAVMVVILIANSMAPRINKRFIPLLLGGVLVSLIASTFVSASSFLQLGPFMGGLCGVAFYLLPLVFASTVFALLFSASEQASTALAFNLVGGGTGVVLEYISMWSGVRALGWIGSLLYGIVLVLQLVSKHRSVESSDKSVQTEMT